MLFSELKVGLRLSLVFGLPRATSSHVELPPIFPGLAPMSLFLKELLSSIATS